MPKKISKTDVAMGGLHEELTKVLQAWRPGPQKSEHEYRNALYAYLRKVVPDDTRVEKEYRHKGTTPDLYLRYTGILGTTTEVFFELKRHLTKKAEFNRVVGQIEDLDPGDNVLYIVLIGESDPSLVDRLKEKYAEFMAETFFGSPKMVLVEVPEAAEKL